MERPKNSGKRFAGVAISGMRVPCHFSSDVRLHTAKIELNEATCIAFPIAMNVILVVDGATKRARYTKKAISNNGSARTCISHISGLSQENKALKANFALLKNIRSAGHSWNRDAIG